MYKVVLVFSVVMWAFVIAVIINTPSDLRRTVQLLRGFGPHQKSAGQPARRVQEEYGMARSSRQRHSSKEGRGVARSPVKGAREQVREPPRNPTDPIPTRRPASQG